MRLLKTYWLHFALILNNGVLPIALAVSVVGCGVPWLPPEPDVPPIVDPDITPIVSGTKVLIVYESAANNSRETLNTLNSTELLSLLNSKAEWRKWDKTSIDASGLGDEDQEWRAIWSKVSASLGELPKIVIVRNGKATVLPLPSTEKATIELVRKAVD